MGSPGASMRLVDFAFAACALVNAVFAIPINVFGVVPSMAVLESRRPTGVINF